LWLEISTNGLWRHGVVLDYSRPGKPTDNAFAEGLQQPCAPETPDAFWFLSLDDARCKIEARRVEYNTSPAQRDLPSATGRARAIIGCSMQEKAHHWGNK
jgi:putative transposase